MKKQLLILNLILLVYSAGGICSKLAAAEPFLSLRYCVFQCGMIGVLGIYAIAWQQIIKKMPLTTAYMNKSVTIFWSTVWGILLFNETVRPGQYIGIAIVIAGVILFSYDDAVSDSGGGANTGKSELSEAEKTEEENEKARKADVVNGNTGKIDAGKNEAAKAKSGKSKVKKREPEKEAFAKGEIAK